MATQDRGDSQRRQEIDKRSEESTALTRAAQPASTELTHREGVPQKHFDDHSAEIRASIDDARRQISQSLDDIQYTVEETLDWRAWVGDHPWETVGLGVAVGFYLGLR